MQPSQSCKMAEGSSSSCTPRERAVSLLCVVRCASSVGLRYSLVFICFSFFISIELVTKRNRYICGSICLMFQMIDIGSLLVPISRPGLFLD